MQYLVKVVNRSSLSDTPSTLGSNKIIQSRGQRNTMRGITGTGIAVDLNPDPNNISIIRYRNFRCFRHNTGLGGPT